MSYGQFRQPPGGGRYGGGRGGGGSKAASRPPIDPNLVVAPYRFADIADAVAKPESTVADAAAKDELLSKPLQGGYCGAIHLEWEAETPLLIGETPRERRGEEDASWATPMRAGDGGDYWIPGSTFRGLLRAACEIVGFGRLSQTNRHYVFSLRDFTHPYYSDPDGSFGGSAVARSGAAQGGWLRKADAAGAARGDDASAYDIEPAGLAYVDVEALIASGYVGRRVGHQEWIESDLKTKYSAAGLMKDGKIDVTAKSFRFRRLADDAQGRPRLAPDPKGPVEGWLFFANATPKVGKRFDPRIAKKVEFVLLAKPGSNTKLRTPLKKEAFRRFELVHTKPGRNAREPDGSWKILATLANEGEGRAIPVIFVGDLDEQGGDFAFGLTRLFKIPHKYSVGQVLGRQTAHELVRGEKGYEPDMIEALFGHVHEPRDYVRDELKASEKADSGSSHRGDALKGRVAVSGARIAASGPDRAVESDEMHTVTMTPRASFAPFYLRGETKDWSDEKARLAGRKLYLPRPDGGDMQAREAALKARLKHQIEALPERARNNAKARSHLKFLRGPGGGALRFTNRLALHNVTAAEIGLILFALTHGGRLDGPHRHLIGRAKPFGAGRVRLVSARLELRPNDGEQVEGQGAETHAPFLAAFCKHMRAESTYWGPAASAPAFPEVGPVRDWLAASDPAAGAKLKGPQPPIVAADDGSAPPGPDTYLRLAYQKPGREKLVRVNPYANLRKATQMAKIPEKPLGPNRLLPGDPTNKGR
jgi:CRISPR-associated protein (TIGR03986 family)